jgi:hypothetical protein
LHQFIGLARKALRTLAALAALAYCEMSLGNLSASLTTNSGLCGFSMFSSCGAQATLDQSWISFMMFLWLDK